MQLAAVMLLASRAYDLCLVKKQLRRLIDRAFFQLRGLLPKGSIGSGQTFEGTTSDRTTSLQPISGHWRGICTPSQGPLRDLQARTSFQLPDAIAQVRAISWWGLGLEVHPGEKLCISNA